MEQVLKYTEQHDERDEVAHDITALVVDDDRILRMIIEQQIVSQGCNAISADNALDALEVLQKGKEKVDIVILDQEMPQMKGLEMLEILKADPVLMHIPVIMVTGLDHKDEVKKGIDAGVFYYLVKPLDQGVFISVFQAAIREVGQQQALYEELQTHKTGFSLIDSCAFTFKSLTEAENLAAFLANCYPNPQRVLPGLARLMINAVEHGNLAISYDDKTEFVEKGCWHQEIERRLNLPIFKDKDVKVTFLKKNGEYLVEILDQGQGFDWAQYLEVDPARAMDNHGRGIAQAKAESFDTLYYNDVGNKVTAIVRASHILDW